MTNSLNKLTFDEKICQRGKFLCNCHGRELAVVADSIYTTPREIISPWGRQYSYTSLLLTKINVNSATKSLANCLCKLKHRLNCSEFLAENVGRRKVLERESCLPNFRAADSSSRILAGLIIHPKDMSVFAKTIRINQFPC